MTVRAKFVVTSITENETGSEDEVSATIEMEAVTNGEGNESWSKWTPAGQLTMTVTNPAALADFAVGAACYLDFSAA
ncbi:hypothetical protein [uncultured Cohaesibacter sp.]|uniref:hypothetical protein n=1 Tax=uncultured Cohaesibacter sp. TaxID=1002546 RepID=UPI0029C85CED|nr:hypothetical protein [uncultured Cohaesibacter sp.]